MALPNELFELQPIPETEQTDTTILPVLCPATAPAEPRHLNAVPDVAAIWRKGTGDTGFESF